MHRRTPRRELHPHPTTPRCNWHILYLINKFQDLLAIKVRRGNKMHNNYPTKALGKSFLRKIAAHIGMASSRKLRGEANQL